MVKKFFKKATYLFLAAAMTATMLPAQIISAAGTTDASDTDIAVYTDDTASDVSITAIEGNTPIFPTKIASSSDDGTMVSVTWDAWNGSGEGTYTVKGTAADGRQVTASVTILPCDEVVRRTCDRYF